MFFDGRNAYEAEVSRFKNAIVPKTQNTRDVKKGLESGKYNDIKDEAFVIYRPVNL